MAAGKGSGAGAADMVRILPITGMEEPQRSRTQAELSCKSV